MFDGTVRSAADASPAVVADPDGIADSVYVTEWKIERNEGRALSGKKNDKGEIQTTDNSQGEVAGITAAHPISPDAFRKDGGPTASPRP